MEMLTQNQASISHNPLDVLEELVAANDWAHDRASDRELVVQIKGKWADYNVCSFWQPEVGAMYLSCQLDIKVPALRREALREVLVAANEQLWMGHFDFCSDDDLLLFRHTIPLRGTSGVSVEQLEDMVDTALIECDRIYPAMQMVIWGGQAPADAIAVALMDTIGEA
jgi:hypothetical protein|tara:strand:+ start:960 stop:1463 length:504 start_codon:yes stop_codon:yes gene_type:complete